MTKDEAEKTFWVSIVSSILFVVFGIYLLFKPTLTITIISRVISIITACIGIFGLYRYFVRKDKTKKIDINIIYSIISFLIAILIFIFPTAISGLIPIALGAYMVINAMLKLGYLKQIKKNDKSDFGVCLFIFIIMILLSLILIINPLKQVLNINQTMGMLIVFYSVLDTINSYLFKNNID